MRAPRPRTERGLTSRLRSLVFQDENSIRTRSAPDRKELCIKTLYRRPRSGLGNHDSAPGRTGSYRASRSADRPWLNKTLSGHFM